MMNYLIALSGIHYTVYMFICISENILVTSDFRVLLIL